jgi:hypothetical protein
MPYFGGFQYQSRFEPILPIVAPTIGEAVYPDYILKRAKSDVARTASFEALQPPATPTVTFFEAVYPEFKLVRRIGTNSYSSFEPLRDIQVPSDFYNVYPDRLVRARGPVPTEVFHSAFVNPQIPQPNPVYPEYRLLKKLNPALSEEFNSPFTPPVVVPTFFEAVYPEFRLLRKGLKPENIPSEFKPHLSIVAPTIGYADYPDAFPEHYRKRYFERNWRPVSVSPVLPPVETGNVLIACINITETYQQHFDSRVWAGPSAQVAAGYPYFIEPSETTASYTEIFDFGSIVSNIIVTVNWNTLSVTGSVATNTTTIETSTDGVIWSAPTIGTSVFSAALRFVRLTINFVGATDKSLIEIYNLQCLLNVHREQDGGEVSVFAADAGGTVVPFNKAFKSIDSITLTPLNTLEQKAVYDFAFPVNPVSFKILLFNSAGARVDGTVTWLARGIF